MSDATSASALPDDERAWSLIELREEYEGEARANLLRILGIGAFYIVELMNYYGLELGWLNIQPTVDEKFHLTVTGLAAAWALVALAALFCLSQGYLPAVLKFATTAADIFLLTAILAVADGPRSPLVVAYFLIIVLASLRLQLGLVRYAAAGTIAGYLFLLGYAKWFAAGRDLMVPRYHELIVLVALALTGILLGQVVRRAQSMARTYAECSDRLVHVQGKQGTDS